MISTLKILKLPEMRETSGRSRSAIYADIKSLIWPPQVSLGGTSVGWLEHEIDAVLRARAAGKTDQEVRELVEIMVAQRTQLMNSVDVP